MAAEAQPQVQVPVSSQRVAGNAVIYLMAQVLSWAVTFLSLSIIPRHLGETAMGQLAVASTAVGTVATLLRLGIEAHVMTEVGRDRQRAALLLGATEGLRLVGLFPLIALSLLVLHFTHASADIWLLGMLYILVYWLTFLVNPMRSVLVGWEDARRVSLHDVLLACSPLLAMPFLRYGPTSIVVASIVTYTTALLLMVIWLRRRIVLHPLFEMPLWRSVILGGLPFMINDLVMQLYTFSSIFILRHFTNEAVVGVYSQAQRLFGTVMFIPTALSMALLPSMARLADTSPMLFRSMQQRVVNLVVVLALPVTISFLLLSTPFTRLLYGPTKFLDMPAVLHVYAFTAIPVYMNTLLYRFLVAQRKNGIWSYFLAGTVALNAILCIILIPLTARLYQNGGIGAALACLIAEICTVVCAFWLLRTNPLTRETFGRLLRSVVAAIGMGLVIWSTQHWFVAIPAALGLGTFILLGWQLRILPEEEQSKLVALLRRKIMRR
jgi:O-antigen/teichoic acid export membrane protein